MEPYKFTRMDKWVAVIVTIEVFPWPRWLGVLIVSAILGATEGAVIEAWKDWRKKRNAHG